MLKILQGVSICLTTESEIYSMAQHLTLLGKLASYCLESNLSWDLMKEYLSISNEVDAIEITETMEQYNHEGT